MAERRLPPPDVTRDEFAQLSFVSLAAVLAERPRSSMVATNYERLVAVTGSGVGDLIKPIGARLCDPLMHSHNGEIDVRLQPLEVKVAPDHVTTLALSQTPALGEIESFDTEWSHLIGVQFEYFAASRLYSAAQTISMEVNSEGETYVASHEYYLLNGITLPSKTTRRPARRAELLRFTHVVRDLCAPLTPLP